MFPSNMKEPHAATFKLFGHTIQLTSAARFSGRLTSNPPIPPPSFQETPTKEEGAESDQDTEPSSSPSNNEGNEPSSSKSESEKQQEETEPGKEEKAPEGGPAINRWVPCPRCESSDTKFCYFNNYNVSQPRHFCRRCQRYWTNGGNQRNLPIGSGRRKRKTKRPDTSLSDKILSGLYRSSSSSTSSSPSPSSFVISSSACYGTEDLDLHGLNGLLAWPNGRILP